MRILGLQSGTSLDGIDAVIVDFKSSSIKHTGQKASLQYEVINFKTFPWTNAQRDWLLRLREGEHNLKSYCLAHYNIAEYFADAALALLAETATINRDTIDLISSHGLTFCSRPHLELGELSVIAQKLGITTVGDFRPADVASGGAGGPCTCTYDSLFLRSDEDKWRTCLNIGGTCSVTFCPPQSSSTLPSGFDIGLGSLYIDWAAKLYNEKLRYDPDGEIAKQGLINNSLLQHMLGHPYFLDSTVPSSIFLEDFGQGLFNNWYQMSENLGCSLRDFITTLTELTALIIVKRCKQYGAKNQEIIVRGGIKNNSYFMSRLLFNFDSLMNIEKILSLKDIGYSEDSWETVTYAMMGWLCVNGLYNFIPSCTGAKHPTVGGKICPGENYRALIDTVSKSSWPLNFNRQNVS